MSLDRMKTFILWAFKVATAIVFAIVALVIIFQGYAKIHEIRGEKSTAHLREIKFWPEVVVESINGSFNLSTKCEDGVMRYQMRILRHTPSKPLPELESVTIIFYDKNNFKLFDRTIQSSDLYREVSASGKTTAYSANDNSFVGDTDYEKAESWSVSWRER